MRKTLLLVIMLFLIQIVPIASVLNFSLVAAHEQPRQGGGGIQMSIDGHDYECSGAASDVWVFATAPCSNQSVRLREVRGKASGNTDTEATAGRATRRHTQH